MRIADSALETVRQRVDIAELVKEYVPNLKRSGRNLKACCPFHQEKTPSFMVNPEKQIFHCFGCGEGGDAFTFLMKMENLSFTEAVEKLAERTGVPVEPSSESLGPREKEALKLREALVFALEFYHKVLITAPEADAARRYLDKRGLNSAMRDRFGIGFALSDGSSFLQAALRKGYSPDLLAKAGLAALREGAGQYRDYFRGRILYPIRNVRGDVVGFGARAMGDVEPKYLNSPDTVLFSKGRVLYGLFEGLSEVRKSRRVMLMEGYMDVLAAHQFGMVYACAPLGTAVTPDHADLLKRYADHATIVFDPDNAGANASLRGAETLLERGLTVRIATIPGGLDPDELLHQKGTKELEGCIERAQDLPDFQISRVLSQQKGPLSAEQKSRIAQDILATIMKSSDEVLKGEWIRRLAQRLQVDESSLLFQVDRIKSGKRPPAFRSAGNSSQAAAGAAAKPSELLSAADENLLRALFKNPRMVREGSGISEEDFEQEQALRIFKALRELFRDAEMPHDAVSWSGPFLKTLPAQDAAVAGALLVGEMDDENPAETLKKILEEGRLLRRYRQLHVRVNQMHDKAGAEAADAELTQQYHQTLKQLSDLRLLDRARSYIKETPAISRESA